MMLTFPNAADRIQAAIDAGKLKSGSWGGAETVCMMSAIVSGASDIGDCVTAGWPKWLVELNVYLFDAKAGVEDETAARNQFALDVAKAVQVPRDYDKARDLFLIYTLERVLEHDTANVVQPVIDLLNRRISGDDVAGEMDAAARAAARAAAHAARADLIKALNQS